MLLQELTQRLQNIIHSHVRIQDREIHVLQVRLNNAFQALMLKKKNHMDRLEDKLHLLDPVNLLRRGYSITLSGGKIVRSARMLEKGQQIETILHDGKAESLIINCELQIANYESTPKSTFY